MKIYFKLIAFAFILALMLLSSCMTESEMERKNKSKVYSKTVNIHSDVDSTYTNITYYVNNIEGHKYIFVKTKERFGGELKVVHLKESCDGCSKKK